MNDDLSDLDGILNDLNGIYEEDDLYDKLSDIEKRLASIELTLHRYNHKQDKILSLLGYKRPELPSY